MASNLRQRAVVSSFICTSPESPTGVTFALFKRSQDVSTYPGKWAVCSGSIEQTDASPENAARREISEETTLDDNDITLLRRGKPFSLIDKKLKTKWTIHPFAWQLKPNAKPIKFDWEHTEYCFIAPEDLDRYDHVPQLEVGMDRVLVNEETERGLRILRDDHESGAQALAVKALEIFLGFMKGVEMAKLTVPEEFWKELKWRAWHLAKNGRPSMSAAIEAELFKALDSAQQQFDSAGGVSGGTRITSAVNLGTIVQSAIETRIAARRQICQSIANYFVKFIESSPPQATVQRFRHIATLSSSGTIMQCFHNLIEWAVKDRITLKLSVLESRPRFEGVSFVNALLEPFRGDPKALSKISIEILSDASVGMVLREADFLVLGGDKVLSNGDVSNKIGSLAAALVARSMGDHCNTVAVFDTGKVSSEADNSETEYNDPAELTDAWPSKVFQQLKVNQADGFKVQVKNSYFEWVSHEYIDWYITEQGTLGEDGVRKLAAECKVLEERLFSDL